eukprot:TRINITY_DN5131_c0_g1_i1.p1 TRINITY_DN5131_c0_g1~~TRINITY_DN5131_c0_g1_i1.p1  ORF type:complete len:588 (+),score=121.23 TRINITY_DN5131_c0_g1_i1:53-1816(+)
MMLRFVLIATALAMVAGDACNSHADCSPLRSGMGEFTQFCGQSAATGSRMCADCILCTNAVHNIIVPVDACLEHCSKSSSMAPKPIIPAKLPELKIKERHVDDSTCEDIWNGVYSPAIKASNQLIGLRQPVSYAEWHPHLQSVNTFAHYNCLLNSAMKPISNGTAPFNSSSAIVDWPFSRPDFSYSAASKQTLQAAQQHVHRHLAALTEARRDGTSSTSHDQGFQQFLDAIVHAISEGQELASEFKTCLSDIKTDAMDLYSWYTSGHASRSWESVVISIATAARDCAHEAQSQWHYAWLEKLETFGSLVLSGDDVFDHCKSVYTDLKASSLDWSKLGTDVGACINTLKNDIKRRDTGIVGGLNFDKLKPKTKSGLLDSDKVYQQLSSSYAVRCAYDGTCNHKCYQDEDCEVARYHYRPSSWYCPQSFYHDSDCDSSCGASDPVCSRMRRSAPQYGTKINRYDWMYPQTLFTGVANVDNQRILDAYDPVKNPGLVVANKMAAVAQPGAPNPASNNNAPSSRNGGNSSSKNTGMSGGAIAGVVIGVAVCAILVVVVVVHRRKSTMGQRSRDLTSTLIEHVDGGYEPYEQ